MNRAASAALLSKYENALHTLRFNCSSSARSAVGATGK